MEKFKTVSLDVSAFECNIETPCIICGDGVPVFGDYSKPKVCENCKNAVMKVRDFYGKSIHSTTKKDDEKPKV